MFAITMITLIVVAGLLVSLLSTDIEMRASSEQAGTVRTATNEKDVIHHLMPSQPLSEEIIFDLTDQFIETIKQPIDENYYVIDKETKADIYQAFDDIATREASGPFVSYYFTEEEEGLALLPTSLPPFFMTTHTYDIIEETEDHVIIQQDVEDIDLYGPYTIILTFVYEEGWKISQVDYL